MIRTIYFAQSYCFFGWCVNSFSYSGMIACLLLCCWPLLAVAQLRGDREVLRFVATQHRANRDAIFSWQGEAKITHRLVGKVDDQLWDLTTEMKVTFANDRTTNKSMFSAIQVESGIKQGEIINKSDQLAWGRIGTSDGIQEVSEWYLDGKEGYPKRPRLHLKSVSNNRPGDFSPTFDPFWYLTIQGTEVHDRLMFFYEKASLNEMNDVQVSRVETRIKIDTQRPRDNPRIINLLVFDLNQGANAIQVDSKDEFVNTTRSLSYEQVSGIWVPKLAITKNTNLKTGVVNERQVTWLKNVVNEPMPPNAFSPEQLAIRQGDIVNDMRSGVRYKYDDPGDSEDPAANRKKRSVFAVVAIVLCAACALLAGWRIRKHRKRGYEHAGAA